MNFPGDISKLTVGDTIRTVLPINGFFKPAIGKEYQLAGTSGRAKVTALQETNLFLVTNCDLEAMLIPSIIVIKDGKRHCLTQMECFERYWRNQYSEQVAWDKNPRVSIVDMECIYSLHTWYNDQTGFYDYAAYYGQLDAFGKSGGDYD